MFCKSLSKFLLLLEHLMSNPWFFMNLNIFTFFPMDYIFFVRLTDRIHVHCRTLNHCDCSFFCLRKVLWQLMCILKCHCTLHGRRRMNKRSDWEFYSDLEFPKLTISRITEDKNVMNTFTNPVLITELRWYPWIQRTLARDTIGHWRRQSGIGVIIGLWNS